MGAQYADYSATSAAINQQASDKSRLPIDALGDPLQCLVGRQMVGTFLATYTGQWIGEHRISTPDAELNRVLRCAMQTDPPSLPPRPDQGRTPPSKSLAADTERQFRAAPRKERLSAASDLVRV